MTMIYAIFGIPLMLLCLANIGSTMADAFRFIYCNICCSYCNMVKKRRNLRALQSVELSHNTSSSLPPSPNTTTIKSNTLQTPSNNIEQQPAKSLTGNKRRVKAQRVGRGPVERQPAGVSPMPGTWCCLPTYALGHNSRQRKRHAD